ncbi:MAG TPA: enoyl-CoA hydratase [Acidimicrobiales bacterium]|nr:enoyl-CoA hydratase [Acidimicrobiales bacterium]
MSDSGVEVHVDDGIGFVRLSRAARRNAMGLEFMQTLEATIDDLAADASVRVLVVEADGPAFSAGHDIAEMLDRDERYYVELFNRCSMLMRALRHAPQPVIAKVDGVATAAGCQLVAGCDLAVASDRSKFATPGVRIGLFCSTPMVPVSRAIGMKRALEMLLTGEPIDAQTALEWGLVNRVVPAGQLDAAVVALAGQIMQFSADTLALGKRAFYEQLGLDEPAAYSAMTSVMVENALQPVAREGMHAFVEKRPPVWPRP